MIKRNIFQACVAFILTIAGFFAGRANNKYSVTGTAYFRTVNNANWVTLFKGCTCQVMHLTTILNFHTAFFRTSGMTGATCAQTLFYAKNTADKLYFK